jgi:tRNA (guanine-N7-)-methyltransferase
MIRSAETSRFMLPVRQAIRLCVRLFSGRLRSRFPQPTRRIYSQNSGNSFRHRVPGGRNSGVRRNFSNRTGRDLNPAACSGNLFTVVELIAEQSPSIATVEQLFDRSAPLHVDLGCGDGTLLRDMAAQHPQCNFVGVERLLHRVRSSDRKAAELSNVRILRGETMFVLHHVLAPESVSAFYLLFPDPWPKRRHHRRRLVTAEFLHAVAQRLTRAGSIFIATDHDEYFSAIKRAAEDASLLESVAAAWGLPQTTFEERFTAAGMRIHRLVLRKVSPVR